MEKESSKRSWPWKKKSSDKISAAPELGTSPNSSRLFDDQQKWDYHHQEVPIHVPQPSPPKLQEQAKISHDRHDRHRGAVEEARNQWQQSEERAKALNDKLLTALADITTKDNLVKQHVKVAEEAVTGWEKAEAEAVALKTQLDVALAQKLATEDRVAHLDGALKECMKQLRHVREEQEQRIHDTLVKKTREYDKLRVEMETRLLESSHFLAQTRSELLESRAEVTALSHALQERSRNIAEISEAKGRAETDIKILQVRLETVEKENSQLKYEVHVLNKELEIRGEEREYERKAVDMASKQHLESVKKIAKLEEECNRLRLLVRKKLPGPAAIQRMRMEVEGIGKDPATEKRRRSLGRSVSNLDQSGTTDAMQENSPENGRSSTREAQMLAERVVAMDEEMKMLKEALSKRNGELQSARLMCSKTATRLSVVEDELKKARQQTGPLNVIKANASKNEGSETWMTDHDHVKKGKSRSNSMDIRRESQNFELMDDFAEMERLAMTQALTESEIVPQTVSQEVDSLGAKPNNKQEVQELQDLLAAKSRDLESAREMCQELKKKLTAAETQLTTLQSRNSVNEASIINLQDQLDLLNEAQQEREKRGTHSRVPSGKGLSGYTIKDILGKAKKSGHVAASASDDASSSDGEDILQEHASVSDAESKASTVHSELAVSIRRIIQKIEGFAKATGSDFTPLPSGEPDSTTSEVSLQVEWKNLSLDNTMRNLAHVSNRFLQGKYDIIDFMTELGTALDSILALKPFDDSRNGHLPISELTSTIARDDQEQVTNISAEEELQKIRKQYASVNADLARLKSEKEQMESHLEEANDQVEDLKAQLYKGDRFVANKQIQRRQQHGHESPDADGRKEDDMIEEELMVLSSTNPALRAASGELTKLHDKVAALQVELHGERQRHQNVATKLSDLEQQVRRGGHAISSEMSMASHGELSSHSTSDEDEDTKSEKLSISDAMKHERQEREIAAAALAECQRTILALGKQLKGMGAVPAAQPQPQPVDQPSPNSSIDSATSIQKMTENMEYLRWQSEVTAADHVNNIHNHAPSGLRERGGGGGGSPWNNPAQLQRRVQRSPSPVIKRGAGANGTNGLLYPHSDTSTSFYSRAGDQNTTANSNGNGNGIIGTGTLNGHHETYLQRPPSPTPSDHLSSIPGSPSRISPGALFQTLKAHSNGSACRDTTNGDATTTTTADENGSGEKPRNNNSSNFSRFYSRSGSASSGNSLND